LILLFLYLASLLALEFTNNDVQDATHTTSIGVRAGWLAVAQFPLLILLAGKNNLIGLFTGHSYEKLNVFHRWVSRGMLLMATIHFASQSVGWDEYGLLELEWSTDTCPPTGIAAYAVLLWLNLSTLAPLRNLGYEFFVVQHLLSFFGFVVAIMMHLPTTALYSRVYVYIPIGLWFLDRVIRSGRYAGNNAGAPAKATVLPMEGGGVTKIVVKTTGRKPIKTWQPGAWVLLSIPKFGMGQSHPATILSTPQSHGGDMVFLLKRQKGFTKKIHDVGVVEQVIRKAEDVTITTTEREEVQQDASYTALIDGPYGTTLWDADLTSYTTVLLIAGSTGITYTLSHFLNLAERCAAAAASQSTGDIENQSPSQPPFRLRTLHFIHIMKSIQHTSWLSSEIQYAIDRLAAAGIQVMVRFYVTCDDGFTDATTMALDDGGKLKQYGWCRCQKQLGPCCCTSLVQELEINKAVRTFVAQQAAAAPPPLQQNSSPIIIANDEKKSLIAKDLLVNSSDEEISGVNTPSPLSSPPQPRRADISLISGRPNLPYLLHSALSMPLAHNGETAVLCCGPLGLTSAVRNAVAKVSDERAVSKGGGGGGIVLRVEGQDGF